MNRKEYKDKIEMFEKAVHPYCFVTVKDVRIKKNIVIADIYIEPKNVSVYRDCRYKIKELENDTIFMRI